MSCLCGDLGISQPRIRDISISSTDGHYVPVLKLFVLGRFDSAYQNALFKVLPWFWNTHHLLRISLQLQRERLLSPVAQKEVIIAPFGVSLLLIATEYGNVHFWQDRAYEGYRSAEFLSAVTYRVFWKPKNCLAKTVTDNNFFKTLSRKRWRHII